MDSPRDDGQAPGLTVDGPVAALTVRRPGRLNRLGASDLIEIQRLCGVIGSRPDIRVVVLTADTAGQARPVFSAGYDVAGFDGADHDPRLFERTVDTLAALRPVLIAGLNGSVYGGATDLVLACDLRIGQPGLSWRMPACALGLHYYPSGLQRYRQAFGPERARQLFLTADPVSSDQLHTWGVLMALAEPADWATRLQALAQQVAALAPLATQGTKASLRELAAGHTDEAVLRAREAACAASEDFREGRQAMAERRPPVFKGR
ncbi:MAG: enoyl-CoA hydratase-related protein [Hydrogenophaga sp.]|jgi:enoyl-CoA hydratase/carnithine racemase|nr:enoyl-CoA hydratase-related protein [Hydrogenophaga sp.]